MSTTHVYPFGIPYPVPVSWACWALFVVFLIALDRIRQGDFVWATFHLAMLGISLQRLHSIGGI